MKLEPLKLCFLVLSYKLKDSGRDAEIQFLLNVYNKRMEGKSQYPSRRIREEIQAAMPSKRSHAQLR